MKQLLLIGSAALLLAGCGPKRSVELAKQSRDLSAEIERVKSIEGKKAQESRDDIVAIEEKIAALEAQKAELSTQVESLRTEHAAIHVPPAPTPLPEWTGLDTVTLSSGKKVTAEIKELRGDNLKLVVNGKEQTGKLSSLKNVSFRQAERP